MRFTKYIPYGNKQPRDITSTSDKETQLWQELSMLRHIATRGLYGKKVIAPYIDQAKTYYLDACSSHWKSSGLLYYYSFLNLAKAYIVTKRALSASYLKSTNIYHGLQSNPQNISRLTDFTINIHPPTWNNRKNIFSLFYEKLVGQSWPFSDTISVRMNDVIGYCNDISHELSNFFSTNQSTEILQSLYREDNTHMWIEFVVPNSFLADFSNYIGSSIGTIKTITQLTDRDVHPWLLAHNRIKVSFHNNSLVRVGQIPYNAGNKSNQFTLLKSNVEALFIDFILPFPMIDTNKYEFWQFIPMVSLNGVKLLWHPLLSDYLFSFMLSTILRYHPHVFSKDDQNSFIGEAWCNQSSITTLRYFLMTFTNPSIRMN